MRKVIVLILLFPSLQSKCQINFEKPYSEIWQGLYAEWLFNWCGYRACILPSQQWPPASQEVLLGLFEESTLMFLQTEIPLKPGKDYCDAYIYFGLVTDTYLPHLSKLIDQRFNQLFLRSLHFPFLPYYPQIILTPEYIKEEFNSFLLSPDLYGVWEIKCAIEYTNPQESSKDVITSTFETPKLMTAMDFMTYALRFRKDPIEILDFYLYWAFSAEGLPTNILPNHVLNITNYENLYNDSNSTMKDSLWIYIANNYLLESYRTWSMWNGMIEFPAKDYSIYYQAPIHEKRCFLFKSWSVDCTECSAKGIFDICLSPSIYGDSLEIFYIKSNNPQQATSSNNCYYTETTLGIFTESHGTIGSCSANSAYYQGTGKLFPIRDGTYQLDDHTSVMLKRIE
jgi:hypothetical protein